MIALILYITILSCLSQDVMFDIIIFLIGPVHMSLMLPVMFSPANPSFSFCYKNKRMDFSLLRNLHDDSSINSISICEGVSAVDGIVLNWEGFDGHFPPKIHSGKLKSLVKPRGNCAQTAARLFISDLKNAHLVKPVFLQVRDTREQSVTGKRVEPFKLTTVYFKMTVSDD